MTQDGKLDYHQIPGWHGKCTPGENFNASNCNQKLIGARFYNAGWGGNAGIDAIFPCEFNSPRDWAATARTRRPPLAVMRTCMPTGLAAAFRRDQRHRAARAYRGLQGLLGTTSRPAAAAATIGHAWLASTRLSRTAWM